MIKVFGHLSPDTDTVCSAIVWAWYVSTHTGKNATPYILGDLNTETSFVLSQFDVPTPALLEGLAEGDEVMVVDTNNPQELPDTIGNATLLQLIDHHKLVAGLETDAPADITIRPLACTATVMYDLMGETVAELPKDMAGLMLACILSDTLEFRSPTTTPHDKDVAEKLAAMIDVDITEFATAMFAAKSDVSSYTDSGLIKLDSKKYEVGDKNFRVSVLETTTPAIILERKDGLTKAIADCVAEESDVDDVLFFIIDILKEEATVLTYNDLTKEVVEKSFGVTVESDTEILPGIVSRKKQIIPVLKR